jgi:hypothetical protein
MWPSLQWLYSAGATKFRPRCYCTDSKRAVRLFLSHNSNNGREDLFGLNCFQSA